jgi:hypothetical protein
MENRTDKITIGYTSLLTVIVFLAFFLAKIYNKIDWSWWLVFSPLWIPVALVIIALIIILILIIWIELK